MVLATSNRPLVQYWQRVTLRDRTGKLMGCAESSAVCTVVGLAVLAGCWDSYGLLGEGDRDTFTGHEADEASPDWGLDGGEAGAGDGVIHDDAARTEDRGFEDAGLDESLVADEGGGPADDAGSGCTVAAELAISPECAIVDVPASVPTVTVCGSFSGFLVHVTRGDLERGYARVTARAVSVCVDAYPAGGPDLCGCLPGPVGFSGCARDSDGDGLAVIRVDVPTGGTAGLTFVVRFEGWDGTPFTVEACTLPSP
jgi:hypothetical protein